MHRFPTVHQDTLEMAVRLAVVAHWRVSRMDGSPFYGHCERVMDTAMDFARAADFDLAGDGVVLAGVVGVLHDVVEDTKCPIEFIRSKFGPAAADAVQLLTRPKTLRDPAEANRVYDHTLATCNNPLVAVVKVADVLDNARGAVALIAKRKDENGEGSPEHTKAVDFGRRWSKKALGSLSAVAWLATTTGMTDVLDAHVKGAARTLCELNGLPADADLAAAGYPNL